MPSQLPFPCSCRFVMNESAGTVLAVGPAPDGGGELSGYALWIDPTADGRRRIRRAMLRFDHPALTNDALVVQRQLDMAAGQNMSSASEAEAAAAAVAAQLGGPLAGRWSDSGGGSGGLISPVDFSGFHDRLIRLLTRSGLPDCGCWAYQGVTHSSERSGAGKVEALWQQTPASTLDSMVQAFEGGVRLTATSRVARPGWAATAAATVPIASVASSGEQPGGERLLWPTSEEHPLAAPPPVRGGWRPPSGKRVWYTPPWAAAAVQRLPPPPVTPSLRQPPSPPRLTPSPPTRRPMHPPSGAPPRTRRKPGALDATDPDSSAARRRQRNRLSAAKSNERRRQRRLAALAEAAAAAAAATAEQGSSGGGGSSCGGFGGSESVGGGSSSFGDATSASPPPSLSVTPELSAVGGRLPEGRDHYHFHWGEGGGSGGPLPSPRAGSAAPAGGGSPDATWCYPLTSGG